VLALTKFDLTDDSRSLRRLPSKVSTSIKLTPPALLGLKHVNYLTSRRHRIVRIRPQPSRQWNEHAVALSLQELQLGFQSQYTGYETTLGG
jgi:hypothetical protein